MVRDAFTPFSTAARRDWEHMATRKIVPKGTLVFQEESPVEDVYLLRQGAVRLVSQLPTGRNQICEILGSGNFLNLSAVFNSELHDCSCATLTVSHLDYLDIDAFFDFLTNHPPVTQQLIVHLADQVTDLRRRLAKLGCLASRERLAACLSWLAKEFGRSTPAGVEITLPLTRTDIAEFIGVSTETAIRQLSTLQQEGFVKSVSRRLVVSDTERLAALNGQS